MVRLLCRAFDADRTLFAFLFLVQHDQLKHLPDGAANPVDVLRTCIADAMAAGEIEPGDAAQKAVAFACLIEGAVSQARIMNDPEVLKSLPAATADLLKVKAGAKPAPTSAPTAAR